MKEKENHINIKVTVDEIRNSLLKMIVSEYSSVIVDVIIANLQITEVGMEQLYKAFSGIVVKSKYKIGDKVLVNMEDFYEWVLFDKERQKNAGKVHQGMIKGIVHEINMQLRAPYTIRSTIVGWAGIDTEIKVNMKEYQVHLEDEWPGENTEEDLPF